MQNSTPKPLATRREPPIAFALGLFSGLLAMFFMRALGTPDLDAVSYASGVVIAAACGILVGRGVPGRRSALTSAASAGGTKRRLG